MGWTELFPSQYVEKPGTWPQGPVRRIAAFVTQYDSALGSESSLKTLGTPAARNPTQDVR